MNPEQLIEQITQDIILYIVEDQTMNLGEALNQFYTSDVFEKLEDIESNLYRESAAYIYDLYQIELHNNELKQTLS